MVASNSMGKDSVRRTLLSVRIGGGVKGQKKSLVKSVLLAFVIM